MQNKTPVLIALLLFFLIILSACKPEANVPEISENAPAFESETAEATEALTEVSPAGSCPVGSWDLTDFAPYMSSLQQNLTAMTNNEFTFSDKEFSGMTHFVFNEDQTALFSAANFEQKFTMSANGLEIPISISINGTSTSEYTIEGDQLTFSNQDAGDLVINMDVMGSSSTLDEGMLGQPGTVKLYQFACPDADTLTLKVIAIEDMDLAPLTLTRAK